jgi:hypothetical protein
MSMHPEQDNFEDLRRLLALKRHEQPPPGYFNRFSREVIVRIQAGDFGEETAGKRFFWDFPLLQRLWDALEARPALSGAFGVAVLGFLTAGFLLSDNPGLRQPALVGGVVPWAEGRPLATVKPSSSAFVTEAPGLEFSSPTGPQAARLRANLFPPRATPVKFTLPNGN